MPNLNIAVSGQFMAEADRLNIDPAALAQWLCDELCASPPATMAIPRVMALARPLVVQTSQPMAELAV